MGRHSAGPKHGAPQKPKRRAALIVALVVAAALAGGAAAVLTFARPYVAPHLDPILEQMGLPTLANPAAETQEDAEPVAFTPADLSGLASGAGPLAVQTADNARLAYAAFVRTAPTPVFAYCDEIPLHLAVPSADLTELLFHQASYEWALVLDTPLPETPPEDADESTGTQRSGEQPTGDSLFEGSVLHIVRWGRRMAMDTAVDCGAPAGTPALSPIDGTVVLVEHYLLYNKYEDYQVHIEPTGHPELDVVLIHIDNPCVEAGDHVTAGKTQVGQIRDLGSLMTLQLAEYTAGDDPGNHTHICVNDTGNAGYFGLVGAAVVDAQGNVVSPATITADTPIDEVVKMREAAAEAAGTTDISLPKPASTASTATP